MQNDNWIGKTLASRYHIEAYLGEGGMATVYKATDVNLQRRVAIKLIHPHLSKERDFVNRFEKEAPAVAKLNHAHIVKVYDSGRIDNTYYIIFEYLPGETLYARLHRLNENGRLLPLNEANRIAISIANAVHYAHERGIIHRDIKPANVMFNAQDEPVLMDFGVAKIVDKDQRTITGTVLGTGKYMAPEQAHGAETDARTDVYALGILLFEMVGGRVPFEAKSVIQTLMMHVNEPVPNLSRLRTDAPPALTAIVNKALAKNPEARYQTAQALANALTTGTAPTTPATPQMTVVDPYTPPVDVVMDATKERAVAQTPSQPNQRRGFLGVIGLIIILLLLGGSFIVWQTITNNSGKGPAAIVENEDGTTPINIATSTPSATLPPTSTSPPTGTATPSPTDTATPLPVMPTTVAREVITILNGDFEDGFASWENVGNDAITEEGFRGQGAAVKYFEGGNSDIRQRIETLFESGKVYEVTAWCLADTGETCALFFGDDSRRFDDAPYQNSVTLEQPGTGEWQQLHVALHMRNDEQLMSVFLYGRDSEDEIIYDEVEVSQVLCDFICDSGFENGLAFWQGTENSRVVSSGRTGQAIQVESDDENSDIRTRLPGTFAAGKTYRATVWCRAFVGQECELFFGDVGGSEDDRYQNSASEVVVGNGDWQQLTITLTLDRDEQMSVFLYARIPSSVVIYDDVMVEEVVQ